MVALQKSLFVTDKDRIWRIDPSGKAEVFVQPGAFPTPPVNLSGMTVLTQFKGGGALYVSDSGGPDNKGGAVYRVATNNGSVTPVTDQKKAPDLQRPAGLASDGANHLLVIDSSNGQLHRIRLADGTTEKVAEGFGQGEGLVWDKFGRLFISDPQNGKVFAIPRPGENPAALRAGFQGPAGLSLDASGKSILVADTKAGSVIAVPIQIPGAEVDDTPLAVETAPAFPDLEWTGYNPVTKTGVLNQFRPILLTHAGDGSNRVFVATQLGAVHVFPNDQQAKTTKVFLDIQDKAKYSNSMNEEGFLGMAFHPKFKENGEFFVFYTPRNEKLINVVSRFRVSKDDPNKADPASEEIILRISKHSWNHDGGTIVFGPDGYLYIAIGDGGGLNDPPKNGQNLKVMNGKILRIDVDRKDPGKNYAIPADNPFVKRDDVLPEIWAYGLRNPWRIAFDRQTGKLWEGEVGQDLFEEINIIQKGGNYGWSIRESFHPFSAAGVGLRKDIVEPIWEYHHDLGKSITGGHVYRGKEVPELEGSYLYADYVSNKIWALRFDEAKGRVVANRSIRGPNQPWLSFGEDERGEAYIMTYSQTGKGIYKFVRSPAAAAP
jgi:glucose/arabinose dehydrogenase